MKLKNYQEDIVLYLIDIALKDYPEISADETFIHDVAAYTLNRIAPNYIMSERGFTRFASMNLINEEKENSLIALMMIINMSIECLNTRRKPNKKSIEDKIIDKKDIKSLYNKYIHNFPQFIGRVVDETDEKPIIDTRVTLYINGDKAKSAEPNWPNPYFTNSATNGFYSFWPKSILKSSESKKYEVDLKINHKDYQVSNITKVIETQGTFYKNDLIEGDKIIKLPTCYLIKKS